MTIPVETGTISVHMENIFPIVKKALYNDKEIFLRELVSNAVDAINKFRHLTVIGEAEKDESEYRIEIRYDKENRQLSIIDNGLGLTATEIKKYINEVAFSSAHDFMERFKDQAAQIIGHFGLGFYSAFMVAEKVEIHSLSYQKDAEPVIWTCDGSPNFEMKPGERAERGTEIRLTLMSDETEFAEEPRLQHLIRKYCDFMPYPIYLGSHESLNDQPANKQTALWNRNPKEVSDQEYLDFYHYLFPFAPDPHLWIHLNVEVPFNLRGILYFPKLVHEMDPSKGQIKLFVNNVFVSDQSEEMLPRFLITLQGGLDCPDIPLNVSRSMLQNDPYVQRVSSFITRKVADRLKEMFNKDREAFVKTWDDIHTFIKFGVMEDDKFHEKIKDILLFKTSSEDYVTLEEYLARNPKLEKKVYYTSEETGQQRFVHLLKQQG
ncbi:MAG: molecular chaperone HtpG, partial [Candidatus Sericytochromatia bacterium]